MTEKLLPYDRSIVPQETATKRCTWCENTKSVDCFARRSAAPDGLQSNCKACQKARRKSGTCSVDGCRRALLARGMCTTHWHEWRASASEDALARRKFQDLSETFEGRTEAGENGCVLWTGATSGRDPGQYGVLTFAGERIYAHRAAWAMKNGPVPDGMEIDHICHTRLCVNPDHLRPVTHKQNAEHLAGAHCNSFTGVRGVTFDKERGLYHARVKHNYREIHVGRFETLEDAHAAVSAARRELFTHSDMDEEVSA